jgi:hypothetical protein
MGCICSVNEETTIIPRMKSKIISNNETPIFNDIILHDYFDYSHSVDKIF